ncbi:ABC transporter substrate-binding protein [Virgisporangium aliadipatigenens]|uniref:ABC transporter substrate-binding protein n=1 Tax=Virgisporangium aliadipatigenens TaxID=741659 RepID=A0A8J4DTB0_9ACTN|nr:ABC transporter substrate-binding protein [Virgisporangium aliadipatigenens]GIJ50065.1 ABC transporter substrate-binding protein [Virgisporangium aliadipatigenens]
MAQFDRRRTLKLLASLGAAGASVPLLSACGSDSDPTGAAEVNKGPIKIGLMVPQDGIFKAIGEDVQHGFELYLRLAGNRLGGYTPEVVVVNEGQDANQGKAAAEKLLNQDRVAAMSGVVSSTVMAALKDTVEQKQVPLVGSNASPKALDGTKYIWRTSYANVDPGGALGGYVLRQQGGTGTAYLLAPKNEAGDDELEGFRSAYTRGGKGTVLLEQTPPDITLAGFAQYLNRVKSSQATAVYAFYAGTQAVDFVKAWSLASMPQSKVLYAAGFLTEGFQLLKDQGPAADGIYTSMNYSADLNNLANRRFASEYYKAYQTLPTTYAMASYDAAMVLDKALSLIDGDPNPQAINAAIGKVGLIDSPRGPWQFNINRTPLQTWYLRRVQKDGSATRTNTLISELTTLPAINN